MLINVNVFCILSLIIFKMLIITTLNINGLNDKTKQSQLINFMRFHKIDIMLIQEHNIRDIKAIGSDLNDFCHVSLNLSICHKGGTGILICKSLPFEIINEEKSAESRIMSMKIKIYDQFIHLVNVYAHSGSRSSERDNLFKNDLIYYLRNCLQNTYIGGDWNCVLSERDKSSDNTTISNTLLNTVRSLNLKDVWFLKHKNIEYTFIRNNFGSRIDRAYVKDLANCVQNVKIIHVNFSDHSCVWTEFNIKNISQKGKGFWKLNISLLDDVNIKNSFKMQWNSICLDKNRYQNINVWWDQYAKKEIKSFFIKKGKAISNKKYGLIKYLEYCLNDLYNTMNLTGKVQYDEVKLIKDRIDELKAEIIEGVRIRSRIKEQIDGEKISAFLIKQQANVKSRKLINSVKTEAGVMENLGPDIILRKKDSISMYIKKYFENVYKKEGIDENDQEWFLKSVNKSLTIHEQQILELDITQKEVFETIHDMNLNRAPGIDGIPIEFYIKYWDIIKNELTEIVVNIVQGTLLDQNQRKAIITLLPKDGGDPELLKSWRPISLICVDVKIVAKLLARRIKPLIYSLVSENQFCVQGRSIVDCNCKIRDVMYYSSQNNQTGAIINIDWEKAFDRVNWDFLMKILKKMKFPESVIKWINILYTDIQSVCLINGFFTDSFDIHKGVRQGCPLSMLFYVVFQDPLYVALEKASSIKPVEIPGGAVLNVGYADDTNIFTNNEESFLEIFRIIKKFETATNSKLNINKTKVYGYGDWKDRTIWPINNMKVEIDFFSTLGIIFSSNYDIAMDTMWKNVFNKIKNRIPIIRLRNFTLYQRAALVNCLIASKLWYVSHVYPLPLKYATMINQEIFQFIWGSKANPIKRETLYNNKLNGGLGLVNISQKCKCILASTVMKTFILSEKNDIIRYYMMRKVGYIFNITIVPNKVSKGNTPYYEFTIDLIKKCKDHKRFPNLKPKDIYEILVPQCQPNIEMLYPNYNWNDIWRNLNFKYMYVTDRNIMFKYLHEILPTNKRLNQIRIRDSPLCEFCNVEDSNIHRFYYCCQIQECIIWLKKLIFYVCGIQIDSLLKIMSLNIPKIEIRNRNSLCIIITCYITTVWYHREDLTYIIQIVKANIVYKGTKVSYDTT